MTDQQLGNLLSLKRHEKPPEGTMEDLLREFHLRRREEAVQQGSRLTLWQRFNEWLADPGWAKWACGAGVAYAAVMVMVLSMPRGQQIEQPALQPVNHPVTVPAEDTTPSQLGELDLRPTSEGKLGEQEF
ncbi:hypothetical protein [Haloferula sp. A504]|uniref:hypothetical protein n=1 Tax=Haloferula sp. A504 TaxID=3373601 RepID=UPI0031C5D680|nr:hypothetical protein [Verrucomicrobiaceae bacterium E54]